MVKVWGKPEWDANRSITRFTKRHFWLISASLSAGAYAAAAMPLAAQTAEIDPQSERDLAVPPPPADAALPEVETVISDEEFAREIPDLETGLEGDLDAPLESIAEFEARLARGRAGEADDEALLNDEARLALDGEGQAAGAPALSADLAAPLPPLEAFEVEPVEFAQNAADDETVEVAYRIIVNGLDAADEETPTNLRSAFNSLSSLRDGGGKAANTAQVAARLTEDSALIQRILASEGWFEARAATRIDRTDISSGAGLDAVIDVVPGARYTFAEIVIDAPPVEPENLIRDNLPLRIGEPIVAVRVQAAEARVAVELPENGYPFAEVGERDILLDPETQDGVYTLPVNPGPRARFGRVRTTGDLAFDADHIEVISRFERGELYDSRMIDDLRQALVATGLFNTVAVSPERSGEQAEDGTEYADILVEQGAGPPRTLAGGAGFGTGEGFRLEGSWTHRNLFPPEGALIARAVVGTLEQRLSGTFRRSNAGRRDRTFSATAEASRSDFAAFQAFTGRLSALVSYDSTNLWQKPFTYAYGAQLIGTNEQDFDFERGELTRRTFLIGGLTGLAGIDRTDSLLDATRGFRVTALVEPEGSLQGNFTPYVRALVDGSAYTTFNSITLAGRVRIGTIQGIERFDLAPSRRFYAGGGGSVRGFGFQQLGPRVAIDNPDFDPTDEDNDADPFIFRPIGGRSTNELAAEVRYRFGNFGVVGFVDAGQVYESSTPNFSNLRYGAGIGGRYYTNFGPLRLDVAVPINRQPGESRVTVFVSIGQAF